MFRRGGPLLGELDAGAQAEFRVDVGEVGLHGARTLSPPRWTVRRPQPTRIQNPLAHGISQRRHRCFAAGVLDLEADRADMSLAPPWRTLQVQGAANNPQRVNRGRSYGRPAPRSPVPTAGSIQTSGD
jgi:hypothetical protein